MSVSALKKLMFSRSVGTSLPSVAGFNIAYLFSLFKTQQSTLNYPLIGRLWNGSTFISDPVYIFFDSLGKISMNSKVSATTTPSATSLSSYVGSNGLMVTSIISHITSHVLSGQGGLLVDSGVFQTENGEPCLTFNGSGYYVGTALSALDDTQDFTIGSITTNGITNTLCSVMANSNSGAGAVDRIEQYNDRRTNKRIAVYRNSATTTYENTYIATQDVGVQKRLVTTYESEVEMKSYFDGTLQDTDAISGACDNDAFTIGGRNSSNILTGCWQCGYVATSVHNSGEVSSLDTIFDSIFNF